MRHFDRATDRQDVRPVLIAKRDAIVEVKIGQLRDRIGRVRLNRIGGPRGSDNARPREYVYDIRIW